jgi:hypothetical protein
MIRHSQRIPGYDCIRTPCGKGGCGTTPGSSHGVHNEEWLYAAIEENAGAPGDVAVSLTVNTGIYPDTVPAHQRVQYEAAALDLSAHVAWPFTREDVRADERGMPCSLVASGRCFVFRSTMIAYARDFAARSGLVTDFEQPERFWLALETELADQSRAAHAVRADTVWQRCSHCDATGTVRR